LDTRPEQVELSNDMRKVLQNAMKQTKKNNDSFLGTDALLKALVENKDVAAALTEAGEKSGNNGIRQQILCL
jgi:ATP-dependent Clp protease ATP-binding subunit ClpA